jgi:DNA-binding NarL/FixJ family response regulator
VLDELLNTIRAVHAGKKRIPPDVAAQLADHAIDDALTEREIDVLKLIAAGNGNKQIADELSISEATVKSRVTNILSKAWCQRSGPRRNHWSEARHHRAGSWLKAGKIFQPGGVPRSLQFPYDLLGKYVAKT